MPAKDDFMFVLILSVRTGGTLEIPDDVVVDRYAEKKWLNLFDSALTFYVENWIKLDVLKHLIDGKQSGQTYVNVNIKETDSFSLNGIPNWIHNCFISSSYMEFREGRKAQRLKLADSHDPDPQKETPFEYQSFDDLFDNSESMENCIDALRKIKVGKNGNKRTGIISENGDWIKRNPNKSVLVAWIGVLRKKGKIENIGNISLSQLLENHFKGLSLAKDASTFRKATNAASDYEPEFQRLIK